MSRHCLGAIPLAHAVSMTLLAITVATYHLMGEIAGCFCGNGVVYGTPNVMPWRMCKTSMLGTGMTI